MKKFNIIVICLIFSFFMSVNMISAQDLALNINLSNVEKPIAKSNFIKPINYTGTTSYYNLFNPETSISLSSTEAAPSIMLKQQNPALQHSKFFNFMSVLTSTGSGNGLRFSVRGVVASSLGNVLGLNGGIRGAGCDVYSTPSSNSALSLYSNNTSGGTPVLNSYYNGSTGSSNTGGQTRTFQSGQSSNFIRLGKQ